MAKKNNNQQPTNPTTNYHYILTLRQFTQARAVKAAGAPSWH